MKKQRTLFIGNGKLLITCYEVLCKYDFDLIAVISQDQEVTEFFEKKGIPTHSSSKKIKSFEIDYLFSINNSAILEKNLIRHPRKAAINYHDALLPHYGGYNATAWAILNGETSHGVSWHMMTDEIDSGDILEQQAFDISPSETTFSLNVKCFEAALQSFERLCPLLLQKKAPPRRSHKIDLTTFHYFSQKPKYSGIINCCPDRQSA